MEQLELESLKREVIRRSGTYTMVRPGISIRLTYPTPIQKLGIAIADIIEKYLDFIKPATLSTYLASNGEWKKITQKILNRDLKELRSIPKKYEFVEYHYGHGTPASVGDYGIHFVGSNLNDHEWKPLEENLLLLEFPYNLFEKIAIKNFIDFITNIAEVHPFGSGTVGYSFKHLHLTFRNEAFDAISTLATQYIGFDINSDTARRYSRDHIYNVSWLTLLGNTIVEKLNGENFIRATLPSTIQLHSIKTGLILQAADYPIVGDMNLGAKDLASLQSIAALTRQLRIATENLGPGGDFTKYWLSRFDNLTL